MQLALPLIASKRCPSCGQTKSVSEFSRARKSPDGLQSYCKPCGRARNKANYAANRDAWLATHKAWYAANRDAKRAKNKIWREANPEADRARVVRWHAANRARRKATNDAWRAANIDRWREKQRRIASRRRAKIAGVPSTVTRADVRDLIVSSDGICSYCLRSGVRLTVDHVTAIASGGWDVPENLVAACQECNSRKGDRGVFYMLNRCESARR
jgi:5-methylcytosine-specific restriction endonuclease McrA